MKLLMLILLLTACKIDKPISPPIVGKECAEELCGGPDEPATEPQIEEPTTETGEMPYFYNHSLYFKSFTFWGFNFVTNDRINGDRQVTFTSTNNKKVAIGTQFKRVYAKILFKNGETAKIQYINNSTHTVEVTHKRDWVIYDDMEFHIDGYRQGSFGWHSKIIPTLKNNNEIDDGVEKYERTETTFIDETCYTNIFFQTECVKNYTYTDIYSIYYFE